MTHLQRIQKILTARPCLCDDCLALELEISRRQNVRTICTGSPTIRGEVGTCIGCAKKKIIRSLEGAPSIVQTLPRRTSKPRKTLTSYNREADLRTKFNHSIVTTLGIPCDDYYGKLDFAALIQLKAGYARIHDIITLKLTLALADWVGVRLKLLPDAVHALRASVDSTHPNAAGFDLDSIKPNVIGEVKGNIPMNDLNRFGSAQLKGLTNDVLQMLGLPASHKTAETVSAKSKIYRELRADALKFLGLYDSLHIREATKSWMASFAKSHPKLKVRIAEEDGLAFCPDTVYLVFLTLDDVSVADMPPRAVK